MEGLEFRFFSHVNCSLDTRFGVPRSWPSYQSLPLTSRSCSDPTIMIRDACRVVDSFSIVRGQEKKKKHQVGLLRYP